MPPQATKDIVLTACALLGGFAAITRLYEFAEKIFSSPFKKILFACTFGQKPVVS